MKKTRSEEIGITQETKSSQMKNRRQFFKKAAVGTALISTVASRPVWAVGCSVSGQMSGNLSNPDIDACDALATGKSPGYWLGWYALYDFFIKNPNIEWDEMSNDEQNKFNFNGDGNAVCVLFNWVIAANNSGNDIPYPVKDGAITEIGGVLSPGGGSDPDFNYFGALLSIAHPNIQFPYPGNEWTLQYLADNYVSSENHDVTHELVASFFDGAHIEPSIQIYSGAIVDGITFPATEEGAFNWAKHILGF